MRYSAFVELGLCVAVFLAIPGGGLLLFIQDFKLYYDDFIIPHGVFYSFKITLMIFPDIFKNNNYIPRVLLRAVFYPNL